MDALPMKHIIAPNVCEIDKLANKNFECLKINKLVLDTDQPNLAKNGDI